jgi:MYXO-CTERM domain-containing protein
MALLKVLVLMAALSWPAAASAHHPFDAEFDRSQPHTITGTVSKVEWQSPHVFAYIAVKDDAAKVTNWKVEMGGPQALAREGWTRTSLNAGDQVTIQGFRGRADKTLLNAESFTLANGKSVAAASSMQMTASTMATNTDGTSQAVGTSGQAEALPATASPIAAYGLAGLLALAGALGLRHRRR